MSANKHIEKICWAAIAVALIISIVMMNGLSIGIASYARDLGYESRLFDASKVHTIDIVMNNWDSFIETCEDEEYTTATVLIDGEKYSNVGIRAKGNTSLSNVSSLDSQRYSFKIEFDKYDPSMSYYGLDKISLNNIIQDNTYMKDFLTYQLMNMNGVNAPLCSYVYITVNGDDWGLYLAVEAVEDGFLERNYGTDHGKLYKPDSLSFGGGRGNGRDFDMSEFSDLGEKMWGDLEDTEFPSEIREFISNMVDKSHNSEEYESAPSDAKAPAKPEQTEEIIGMPDMGSMPDIDNIPEGDKRPDMNFTPDDTNSSENTEVSGESASEIPDTSESGGTDFPQIVEKFSEMPEKSDFGRVGIDGGMGSDDVKLIYTDDEYSSYSNIFDNAKTDITNSDKDRLIDSLEMLNNFENLESVVDIDEVIRYFVVHNFVLNFDSYTGSMIHNYYLYEEDGQLSMIPWDYNLAFGGFMSSSDAQSLVNYPIDSPVSGGSYDDRPMLAWIFSNEEYTEMYHEYFNEFISSVFDSGEFEALFDSTVNLISEYVKKDPTKFCTYEEFVTGTTTLRSFCLKRAMSVTGQLNSTIPSTAEGQSADSSTFIDASDISISDMGSMNMGEIGNNRGSFDDFGGNWNRGEMQNTSYETPENAEKPVSIPELSDAESDTVSSAEYDPLAESPAKPQDRYNGAFDPSKTSPEQSMGSPDSTAYVSSASIYMMIITSVILIAGIMIAFFYKI